MQVVNLIIRWRFYSFKQISLCKLKQHLDILAACMCSADLWASPRWRPCCPRGWAAAPTSLALWASSAARLSHGPTRPSFHWGWTSSGQQGTWDQHNHILKWKQDKPRDSPVVKLVKLTERSWHAWGWNWPEPFLLIPLSSVYFSTFIISKQ